MSTEYTKTNWQDGDIITADKMNNIENGVKGIEEDVATVKDGLDSVNAEIDDYLLEVIQSKNLYNPENKMDGYQLYSSGAPGKNSAYNFTGYIDITGCENITVMFENFFPSGAATQNAFYDANKSPVTTRNELGGISTGTAKTFAVPENAVYFGVAYIAEQLTSTSTIMVQDGTEYTGYEPYGTKTVVLPSDETKNARNGFATLGDRLDSITDAIGENISLIEYWGDSLTQGNQDSTGVSRRTVLQALVGDSWTSNNYGVGGEGSNAVSARASGIFAIISANVTIPADGSTVDLTDKLTDIYGNAIAFRSGIYSESYTSWSTVNPCYVNGVECVLQRTNANSPITIRRKTSGSAIVITRPTYIVMNSRTFVKNPVLLICIGQNEGFNRDADELISQIDGIIASRKSDRYIVFGLPHALYGYTWEADINARLKNKYGKKYYDIEEYMKTPVYDTDGTTIISSYALQDAGLTPTETDLTAIAQNQYPPSIMYDGVHFNQYGYTVWGNREYLIGKWLGYWE